MAELDYPGPVTRGDRGRAVRLVQEWLCLQGRRVAIDEDFGPATLAALKAFQTDAGLSPSGTLTQATWTALAQPLAEATAPLTPGHRSFSTLVVAAARQHLAEHPVEVGGQNMGPWVRLYMKGRQGAEWAWCAGFVSTLLQQAATALGRSLPFGYTVSCDSLAALARERELFLPGRTVTAGAVPPGSLFLSRRSALDWVHTGVVVSAGAAVIETIEGNTNDSGDREGFEVCARTRGYGDKDFVVFG